MKSASTILFEEKYNQEPLFKNQLDLVNQLLSDPNSPYYINPSELVNYHKAQNRLKAYISQLLSTTVVRNITEDFKKGLLTLLSKRDGVSDAQFLVESILEPLRQKNSAVARIEQKVTGPEQFFNELEKASYVALITSKPLEIEVDSSASHLSVRKFLFDDLVERLENSSKDLKIYRFNFPLDSYASLFWRGLRRILTNYIRNHKSPDFFDALYNKFTIKTETLGLLLEKKDLNEEDLAKLVSEILNLLNRNRFIMTFHSNAPIFGLPVIALNPSEPKNISVYSLLDEESSVINLYRYSDDDALLWRLFVWDKLKSKQFAGTEIKYADVV